MATCKDCIHFEVCKDYLIECAVHGESERMNVPCDKFKNKADFVEVVRCKDCKRFMEYADGVQSVEGANGDCFIRMMYSLEKQFYSVKYDDFCSYGERKEGEQDG